MKYWTQKRCSEDRVTEEVKKEMFKKENLTTGKATYCPTKNDGNGTREIFQSLLHVFTTSPHLVKRHFLYWEWQTQWNWMQDHFSCTKKMWLVSKESYLADFSPVLYMIENKLLVFLINNKKNYWYYSGITIGWFWLSVVEKCAKWWRTRSDFKNRYSMYYFTNKTTFRCREMSKMLWLGSS